MSNILCKATNCRFNTSDEVGGVGECNRAILLEVSTDNRIECVCYKERDNKKCGECKCQKE